MPAVKAQLKHLRIAPRKVRLVADSIRMKKVGEAMQILSFLPKRSSEPLQKLLHSAEANAKHNFNLDSANLFIVEIRVDAGPVLKRYSPRAMGRATIIRKKTSHITLILSEKKNPARIASVTKELEAEKLHKVAAAKKEPKKKAGS